MGGAVVGVVGAAGLAGTASGERQCKSEWELIVEYEARSASWEECPGPDTDGPLLQPQEVGGSYTCFDSEGNELLYAYTDQGYVWIDKSVLRGPLCDDTVSP